MIFLCGLFFAIERLPVFLQPLSYVLPLNYGAEILHGVFHAKNTMSLIFDFASFECRLDLMPSHSAYLNCTSPLPGTNGIPYVLCWRQEIEISNVLYQRKVYDLY
jgi:hypothetical protein